LGKQRQGGCDLGNAPVLAGPVGPEPVNDRIRTDTIKIIQGGPKVARMVTKDVIAGRIAERVQLDAVDGVFVHPFQGRGGDPVGLHQVHVQFDRAGNSPIARQDGKGLSIGGFGHPHGA